MVPLHIVDLHGKTHAVLGLSRGDMRLLRHTARLVLSASRLGIHQAKDFALLMAEWEDPPDAAVFLRLTKANIRTLLDGEAIEFDMRDWGVDGTLYIGHRDTDTMIALELDRWLNAQLEDAEN